MGRKYRIISHQVLSAFHNCFGTTLEWQSLSFEKLSKNCSKPSCDCRSVELQAHLAESTGCFRRWVWSKPCICTDLIMPQWCWWKTPVCNQQPDAGLTMQTQRAATGPANPIQTTLCSFLKPGTIGQNDYWKELIFSTWWFIHVATHWRNLLI